MGTIGNSSIQESEGYSHEHSNLTVDNINSVFIGISALMLSLQSLLMTSAGDVLRRKQMYIG